MTSKTKEKKCPYCNNSFIPKNYNKKQKYCSLECKNNDKKAKLYNKTCEYCGESFIVSATYKDNKYCSTDCSAKALEKRILISCKNCGKEKEIVPSQIADNGNFCCVRCKDEYLSKIGFFAGKNNPNYSSVKTICGWCKKEIHVIQSSFNKNKFNYCSRECMARHYEIRLAKENNPHFKGGKCKRHQYGSNWFSIRRKARKRDSYVCKLCGKTETNNGEQLSVHHITPFRKFQNYFEANKLENLVFLCRRCHDFIHSNSNIDKIYLND